MSKPSRVRAGRSPRAPPVADPVAAARTLDIIENATGLDPTPRPARADTPGMARNGTHRVETAPVDDGQTPPASWQPRPVLLHEPHRAAGGGAAAVERLARLIAAETGHRAIPVAALPAHAAAGAHGTLLLGPNGTAGTIAWRIAPLPRPASRL